MTDHTVDFLPPWHAHISAGIAHLQCKTFHLRLACSSWVEFDYQGVTYSVKTDKQGCKATFSTRSHKAIINKSLHSKVVWKPHGA